MLVLNLPFKALMFLTLMRPSLVLFLVLWLKLVKDFLKVRDRKSGSAGMPRPISYAVFCLKKKKKKYYKKNRGHKVTEYITGEDECSPPPHNTRTAPSSLQY